VAYDAEDRFLIGVGVKTASVARWVRGGVTTDDRRRVGAAYAESQAEVS
jgi:hypothetical protein